MENESENSTKQNGKNQRKSKLDKVRERIAELEEIEKRLQAEENQKIRKERTRRLIQIGAIAVKYLNCDSHIEPKEFEKILKKLIDGMPEKT